MLTTARNVRRNAAQEIGMCLVRIGIVFALLALASCGRSSGDVPNVVYIVPDGYRGHIRVMTNAPDGIAPLRDKGAYRFEIPSSGELRVRGAASMLYDWHVGFAMYASGETLPPGQPGPVDDGTVALWQSGDGGDDLIHLFVGTSLEWEDFGQQMTREILRPAPAR